MGILEKLEEVQKEMARTQATEYHLGTLKAKVAKYRAMLLEPDKKSKAGEGFDVMKSGDARVALISTLLSKTTKTASEVASYEFTTLTAIPGVIEYEGAKIQLLDLPGIVEGASQGRGRGRQVIAVAKTADLVIILLDATKQTEQRRLLEIELEAVGIRLNRKKPDVVLKTKAGGGITINATTKLTKIDDRMIRTILQSYKIHNCDVMVREDIDTDEFIDVLLGNRKYLQCLYVRPPFEFDSSFPPPLFRRAEPLSSRFPFLLSRQVYNKIDSIPLEEVDRLSRQPMSLAISCELSLNLDYLIERIWDELALVKVYTKKRGSQPDLADPICLRKGATIERVEFRSSSSFRRLLLTSLASFILSLVWGKSSKFFPQPQKVGLTHQVQDEDVGSCC
ncbi:P-loop containing nucleoside triphosphate hydrolase protein [Mrakia frigida]|uniref:P-loop containing nucleoside triphosphate hydrolase protein n=1 Tax=Mrakia frigida TaxID=29902 RepID=UPI003FCC1E4B